MSSYYQLIKPGIVYGNALSAIAAFVFAWANPTFIPLVALVFGLSCSIAGACVFNNVIDRDIDAVMARTKGRALPSGTVAPKHALIFGSVLLLLGLAIELLFLPLVAFIVTLAGVITYVALYTPLKRVSPHATIVGAIAGAVPPVVGYGAATGVIDATALLLFSILVAWQMVHFFAIALYREDDYRAAGIPVMPVAVGAARTRLLMAVYSVVFAYAVLALYLVAPLTLGYILLMGTLALSWTALTLSYPFRADLRLWARQVFFSSIVLLICFSFAIALL